MNTPRRAATILALVTTGVVATNMGCATGGGYPGLEQQEPQSRSVLLRVLNNNWHDMRVYVVSESGRSTRVGMVTGMSRAVLRIRAPLAYGSTRVMLRPIGTRATHTTEPVLITPGTNAELVVHNQLSLSHLITR
jgi:hypothetical protein